MTTCNGRFAQYTTTTTTTTPAHSSIEYLTQWSHCVNKWGQVSGFYWSDAPPVAQLSVRALKRTQSIDSKQGNFPLDPQVFDHQPLCGAIPAHL